MQFSQHLIQRNEGERHTDEVVSLAGFHASLLEVLPHPAAYIGKQGSILLQNTRLRQILADADCADTADNLGSVLSDASWKKVQPVLGAAFAGVPSEATGELRFRSGSLLCHHFICTSCVSISEEGPAILVQFEQTGPESPAQDAAAIPAEIFRQRECHNRLLDHLPDDVVVLEAHENAASRAKKLHQITGGTLDENVLRESLEGVLGSTQKTLYVPDAGQKGASDPSALRKMCEIRLIPLPEADSGRPCATMAVVRRQVDCPHEIAENRRLAYQDALTRLANRRAFTKALDIEMARLSASDDGAGLAVFYIDLDEFKKVNDLGGHDAGDDMLVRVGSALTLALGEFGTAARIGGDEFAGMIPASSEEDAYDMAETILEGLAGIRLEVADRVFTIGGSVGVAFMDKRTPATSCEGADLIALADRACLRGKRFGGHTVHVHTVKPSDCDGRREELGSLPEPGSFRANELALYSLPIVCLKHNTRCGSEILLRLRSERAQGLSSRAWISAAERSGFIAQVDAWTLDKVLDAAERTESRALLTMNVSAESARDPSFRDVLYNRLAAAPLLASRVCLEISEKDFLREPATVEGFFRFVSDLGCQTAVDDFQGHWPVLSRLTGMRVDWLKLEAGLTQQVVEEPQKAAILRGLVAASHELGIKVIAKHVETAEEAILLKKIEVEAAQGFYFGKPEPWADC